MIYILLQLLLLFFLFILWRKYFLKGEFDYLFFLFCFFAFNSAILIDLVTGNISIIEQALLWGAFYFYLEKRPLLFCLLILLISCFKISPILFLALLFISDDKQKYKYFFSSLILFTIYIFLNIIFEYNLFQNFLGNLKQMDYGGISNPSSYQLIKDLLLLCQNYLNITYSFTFNVIIYFAFVFSVLLYSYKTVFSFLKNNVNLDIKLILLFSIIIYVLVLPRVMSYSFIIMLIPSYYIIKKITDVKAGIILFILIIMTSGSSITNFTFLNVYWILIWNYFPLILTLAIFFLYIKHISTIIHTSNTSIPTLKTS